MVSPYPCPLLSVVVNKLGNDYCLNTLGIKMQPIIVEASVMCQLYLLKSHEHNRVGGIIHQLGNFDVPSSHECGINVLSYYLSCPIY